MPRYTPNQANNAAVQEVYPKDQYEWIIGEAKPFFNAGKDADANGGKEKAETFGILYVLTHAAGPYVGKKYFKRCFMHNTISEDMTKQFMLAAHGFAPTAEGEKDFNDKIATLDQAFNTDDGSCGDYWTSIKGGRVLCVLTVGEYNKKPQNNDTDWQPLVQ